MSMSCPGAMRGTPHVTRRTVREHEAPRVVTVCAGSVSVKVEETLVAAITPPFRSVILMLNRLPHLINRGACIARLWSASEAYRSAAAADTPVAAIQILPGVGTVSGISRSARYGPRCGLSWSHPKRLLDAHNRVIAIQDSISGLDGKDPRDRPSPLHPMAVEGRRGDNPNSTTYRIAWPSGYAPANL